MRGKERGAHRERVVPVEASECIREVRVPGEGDEGAVLLAPREQLGEREARPVCTVVVVGIYVEYAAPCAAQRRGQHGLGHAGAEHEHVVRVRHST